MPNRLARETSPYLLQHAHNPVDWFPWGEEALHRALTEDRPILLSIGYSACHWCHVMAHECFENKSIASFMNENFISIKVDREERPDLDHIYMQAVQAMTGGGGWPLTVFLTPQRKPFFGGTYFPPEDRHNLPGFGKVLQAMADAYRHRRADIEQTTLRMDKLFSDLLPSQTSTGPLTDAILRQAYSSLKPHFDSQTGGFGGAPKFPHPLTLEFLLRYYTRYHEKSAFEMVDLTLEKMAGGGIYDQIGGGFHRYATDNEWQYPHFEKMLYDNALLSRAYLHAFQVSGQKAFASIAEETLEYLLREMRSPDGGFYSAQDADSEGQEGKYYLWTLREVREVLGEGLAKKVETFYGVTAEGNFEGSTILHRTGHQDNSDFIPEAKRALLAIRAQRIKPGRDEKVLASWNGLVLAALAEAAPILKRPDFLAAAVANGSFLLDSMLSGGKLRHTFKDGQARIDGFLEDYAGVIDGLMALHQSTLDVKWLKAAIGLTETMVGLFLDPKTGLLFDTAIAQSDLIVRPRNDYDGVLPCGASLAALVLLKMALLTGDTRFQEIAEKGLRAIQPAIEQTPLGYSQWLCDLDFYLSAPREIVLVGAGDNPGTQKLADLICTVWLPDKVVAALDPGGPDSDRGLPFFEGRKMVKGQPAVYICRNNTCQAPITDAVELENKLKD